MAIATVKLRDSRPRRPSGAAETYLPEPRPIILKEYFEACIATLETNRKLGTARNYRRTLTSFMAFVGDERFLMSMLTDHVVADYDEWLTERRVKRNTASFYMRVLRSVYNKASHQNLIRQTYPFRLVYTGVDKTRKRAVDESVIRDIARLDLAHSRPLALTRDIFLFSFCARGMAFVDVAFLRKENITDGYIVYARHKTRRQLTVRLEPRMTEIIARYESLTRESPYVFPLLTATTANNAYRQYQTSLGYYNRNLKRLGQAIGLSTPLTSYIARHTWATTARNHNVPLPVISAGMGHSSEKTTEIYLQSLDTSVIDNANKDILSFLE